MHLLDGATLDVHNPNSATPDAAEVGLGGTVSLLDSVHLYADVDYRIPFGDGRQGAQVIGGLRVAF